MLYLISTVSPEAGNTRNASVANQTSVDKPATQQLLEEHKPSDVINKSLALNNMTMHDIDITNYMAPPEHDIEQQLNMSVTFDPSDPFDEELVARLLSKLDKPVNTFEAYHQVTGAMPHVKVKTTLQLGQ